MQKLLPEVLADGVLDLRFEQGIFRLTLAGVASPGEAAADGQAPQAGQVFLAPKATLLLTEPAFGMLCEIIDGVRKELAKTSQPAAPATSPNFT